jgi:hypothetical protein
MRALRRECGILCMLAALVFAPIGCSPPALDSLPREPISGTVNFDGQPLPKGTIQFRPASQAEATGSVGMINEGRFEIPRNEGPVPGKYKVQIDAREDSASTLAPGELPGSFNIPKKKVAGLIPSRYNVRTELTQEVKSGGPNTFTFDLKK